MLAGAFFSIHLYNALVDIAYVLKCSAVLLK